jgi:hypothetical protein
VQFTPQSPQFDSSLEVSTHSPSQSASSHSEPDPASPPMVATLFPPQAAEKSAANTSAMNRLAHIPVLPLIYRVSARPARNRRSSPALPALFY